MKLRYLVVLIPCALLLGLALFSLFKSGDEAGAQVAELPTAPQPTRSPEPAPFTEPVATKPAVNSVSRKSTKVVLIEQLLNDLKDAPVEDPHGELGDPTLVITLPAVGGEAQQFKVIESPVMHPDLQKRYPQLRSYRGQGINDQTATLRLSTSPDGMHAQVLSAEGAWYVDVEEGGVDVYTRASLDTTSRRNFRCTCKGKDKTAALERSALNLKAKLVSLEGSSFNY